MRIVVPALLALLAGCAPQSFYEGFRVREATRDPLAGQSDRPAVPAYREYETERAKLLETR